MPFQDEVHKNPGLEGASAVVRQPAQIDEMSQIVAASAHLAPPLPSFLDTVGLLRSS